MAVTVFPKEPQKTALKLLDVMFSDEDLAKGIVFKTKRSSKPCLDQDKVSKLFGKSLLAIGRNPIIKIIVYKGSQSIKC